MNGQRFISENQTGWDWFSIHLESGNKLMLFQVRERDGNNFVSEVGSIKTGQKKYCPKKRIGSKKLKSKSYIWGNTMKLNGRSIYLKKLLTSNNPLNENSFMDTLIPYWKGPVKLLGSDKGVGYLEMTGYKKYGSGCLAF